MQENLSGPDVEMVIHYNESKDQVQKNLKKEVYQKIKQKLYLVKGDLSKEKDVNKIVKFAKSRS